MDMDSPTCSTCSKVFKTNFNLKRHQEKCKEKLDKRKSQTICFGCNHEFSRKDSRDRHERGCKLFAEAIRIDGTHNATAEQMSNSSSFNTTTHNASHNTIHIENLTIQPNKFGCDNTSYLSEAYIKRCVLQALPGILKLIERKNFNSRHPENKNIQKEAKRDEYIQVYNGNKWDDILQSEAISDLLTNTFRLTDTVIDKILKPESMDFLDSDEETDAIANKLTGMQREEFIKGIQGYVHLLQTVEQPFEQDYQRERLPKEHLNKERIFKLIAEKIFRHSDNNHFKTTQKEISQLRKDLDKKNKKLQELEQKYIELLKRLN